MPSLAENHAARAAAFLAAARGDVLAALPPDPHAVILDLACGAGATGALALKDGKCGAYVGIEANPAAASEARFAISDVVVGDLATVAIPGDPKTFDVVIAGSALAGLADPPGFLGRLVPLMRPGGRLFAAIPAGSPHRWEKIIRRAGLVQDAPKPRKGLARLFAKPPKAPYDLRAHKRWR
ncbi:MAG TPA: class I SAM-dependent methyltransferase [Caulobacteraceae bacterium]|jgi:SAM-dependent methyltransferase|nr:class I SAM-dependent methyltransferase [Caulobacteraceae bacterium]